MTIIALTPRGDYAADRVADWGLSALARQSFTNHQGTAITVAVIRAATGSAKMVFYFGHGQDDAWIECAATGFNTPQVKRSILGIPDANALGPTVVLAVACLSAKGLGPAAVASGAQRFVGFRESLFWYPQSKRSETAVAQAVEDLVRVTVSRGAGVTLADLKRPLTERVAYFRDLSSRGDVEAVSIAGTLAILADSLTLH